MNNEIKLPFEVTPTKLLNPSIKTNIDEKSFYNKENNGDESFNFNNMSNNIVNFNNNYNEEKTQDELLSSASSSSNNNSFINSISSNSSNNSKNINNLNKKSIIDDETRKIIVDFINKRRDKINKIKQRQEQQHSSSSSSSNNKRSKNDSIKNHSHSSKKINENNNYKIKKHKDTFYIGREEEDEKPKNNETVIDKFVDFMGIELDEIVGFRGDITMKVLIDNKITIKDLILQCKLSITNLKPIILTFEDLIDLKFRLSDLVINRKLFNVNQFTMFFNMNYESLRNIPHFSFNIVTLINCNFYATELLTLGFSFHKMIKNGEISKEQLEALNLSLPDLMTLGFNKKHLKKLNISEREALSDFQWKPKDYKDLLSS
jgi:hypothetical protein